MTEYQLVEGTLFSLRCAACGTGINWCGAQHAGMSPEDVSVMLHSFMLAHDGHEVRVRVTSPEAEPHKPIPLGLAKALHAEYGFPWWQRSLPYRLARRGWHAILHATGWAPCRLESKWDAEQFRVLFLVRCTCGKVMRHWHTLRDDHARP